MGKGARNVKKYEIIYADPPWPYTSFGTAKLPYKSMSWDKLKAFDLSRWMAKDCVLFFWCTGPLLMKQMSVLEHYCSVFNLEFQGVPFIWVKTSKDGSPIKAAGPRPRLVKPLDEFVMALSTGKGKRTFPLLSESIVQHQFSPKPGKGEHSRKPAVFRELIVDLLGDRPRIELFSRDRVKGWDGWGDEYPKKAKKKEKL